MSLTKLSGRLMLAIAMSGMCILLTAQSKDGQSGSQNSEAFKLSVKSNLVLVPVIVTDKHGKHITGLKAEDFEIKENGSAQKIIRIDELTSEASKVDQPAVASNAFTNELVAEHPKKLEIVALDHVNTPFASSADANRGVIDFLARNTDSNTLIALVTMEHNGVRIVHNFTTDPSVLVAAVQKARAALNSRDARTLNVPGDSSDADVEVAELEALLNGSDNAKASAKIDASMQAQEALITLECLQQLSQYFAGVPGRKSLIWASTSFPFSLGSNAGSLTRGTTRSDWERTMLMLQDANIAVYPVDVGGLVQGGNANSIQSLNSTLIQTQGAEGGVAGRSAGLEAVGNGSLIDPTAGREQTMRMLADMTGGEAFYNSNGLSELFRRAGEDSAQYYMLSYYTSNTGKPGWRKLSVKIRHGGDKVRSRSGFYFNPAGANQDLTRQSDELMALNSDLSFASVPLKGQWHNIEQAGDERKVHFTISIPAGVPFVDSDHDRHISLDFRVIATDAAGKTFGNIGQRMETNLRPEDVKTIQTKGLDYANELTLPPGQYRVHFVVRDNLRGALGSIVTPLTVK